MGKIRELAAKSSVLVKIVHSIRGRKSIKKILEEKKKNNELKIIIGASGTNQKDWISTERETFDMLKPEKWLSVVEKHSIKYILAEHVFEHLTIEEGKKSIETCLTFLKEGGNLRIAVPDAFHPSKQYREYSKPGGSGSGASDHKEFYDYRKINKILSSFTDFIQIIFLEYYDENGKLHTKNIDKEKGLIERTTNSKRILPGTNDIYSSLIVDIILKKKFENIKHGLITENDKQ
tara:strand:+ start:64 stop:765 length:702 start_codon:yes stop_codon:yes gene_type:complete